jgi:hypothetical protein
MYHMMARHLIHLTLCHTTIASKFERLCQMQVLVISPIDELDTDT